MGAAADIDPKIDGCPPNGDALGAAVDEPTTPSSDILLLSLSTGALDGDETSNATSRELPASPRLDDVNNE